MMLYLRCLAGKKGRRKQTRSRVPSLRLLIVDDHPLVRQGLRRVLEREKDIEVIGEVADGQEAIEEAKRLNPDVIHVSS